MLSAVCIGETMAMLTPDTGLPLERADSLHLSVGGAESNVALGLAAMGLDTHWVGRVGRDGFGARIVAELSDAGVGVTGVEIDEARPTGLYVKVPVAAGEGSSMLYYRQGSAASAMSPRFLDSPRILPLIERASLIHLSGITPALSEDCRALVETLFDRRPPECRISFDVNWRPALWSGRDPGVLRELADRADIVLAGRDEAVHAFGTDDLSELRRLLPGPDAVVVKDASLSATAMTHGWGCWEVPALQVEVVEPVGAGDSFAAGYLSGVLLGLDERMSLRRGHVAAACTLTVRGDRGPLPGPEELGRILACSDDEWAAVIVREGRFTVGSAAGPGE